MATPVIPATPELTINNTAAEIKAAMEAAPTEPIQTPAPVAPAVAPVTPAEPSPYTASATPEGVEIRLETGAVYKGKTWEEAAAALAKGKVEADKTIHQLKAQPVQPSVPAAPVVEPPNPPQETPEEIATRNWIIEQQAKAFGLTPEQYREAVQTVFSTTQETVKHNQQAQLNNAWIDFTQACPDFADTPETTGALVDYLPEPVIKGVRPPSADEFKAAHALALYNKRYTPVTPTTAPTTPIPPVMPTAGTGSQAPESNPWAMPLDQLKKAALG